MIRLNKTVTLMLPFRRYPLRLSHRLLSSLGGVSCFMLRALDAGLTPAAIADITGLSDTTVVEQLDFLSQHGFVQIDRDDPLAPTTLSPRGRSMVDVEQLLKNGEPPAVWLDAFTLKRDVIHLLVNPDTELLLPDPTDTDFSPYAVAVMPARPRHYRNFDETGRLHTLLNRDVLVELLAVFWPDATALIEEQIEHWEYALGVPAGQDALDYLPVAFEPDALSLDPRASPPHATLPPALLPVLDMTLHFSRAEGFPWPVAVPAPVRQTLDLVSHSAVPGPAAYPDAEPSAPGEALILPASLELESAPPDLCGAHLSPGLSATLSARQVHVRCHLDHTEFQHQLQALDGVRHFSAPHQATKAEAFA